jgi:hypothetical protein
MASSSHGRPVRRRAPWPPPERRRTPDGQAAEHYASDVTTESAPRPFWVVALGGLVGLVAGMGWTRLVGAVTGAIDDAGFRWPLPWPLAILAVIATFAATWLPWIPLFRRVGFPWWFAPLAGVVPLVGVGLAGCIGVRLASGVGRPRRSSAVTDRDGAAGPVRSPTGRG